MCNCMTVPIGDHYSKDRLHINWSGETKKVLDTAPEWANALVEAVCEGHRQSYWVDNAKNPTVCNVKGRFDARPIPIAYGFSVIHVWQENNRHSSGN